MKPQLRLFVLATLSGLAAVWAQPPLERPRRGDREGKRPPPPPLETYLDKLEKENPEEFQRLRQLRESDPQAFRMELREKAARFREGGAAKNWRPHPLQDEIARVRAATSPAEREQAVSDLKIKIAEQIDRTLAEREQAIEKFGKRLKSLEAQNLEEKGRRDEIVAKHLQRILADLERTNNPPTPETE